MTWLLFLLLWAILLPEVGCVGDPPFFFQANLITLASAAIFAGQPNVFGFNDECGHRRERRRKTPLVRRCRKSACDTLDQLGPVHTRWAHRMNEDAFWKLCRLLRPHSKGKDRSGWQAGCKNGAPNGLVPTPSKVSVALRWFAGGDAYDISVSHGVSHNAMNSCPELAFRFPTSREEQYKIAKGFEGKSKASFSNCCGAIDGILTWMEKPSDVSCNQAKCRASKFVCGRKKKFGLNMQGTVDHHRRFLDASICHPASTSDLSCF